MKTRALTITEVGRILHALTDGTHADLFRFLFFTGARISEALAVRLEDVADDLSVVTLRTAKGGAHRTIPIAPPLRSMLKRRRARWASGLFSRVHERTFRNHLAHAARLAGVPGRVSPHTLRHTFATIAHQAGASSRTVQALLGHRTIRSTETYLHTDPRDIDRAVHSLPRIV